MFARLRGRPRAPLGTSLPHEGPGGRPKAPQPFFCVQQDEESKPVEVTEDDVASALEGLKKKVR